MYFSSNDSQIGVPAAVAILKAELMLGVEVPAAAAAVMVVVVSAEAVLLLLMLLLLLLLLVVVVVAVVAVVAVAVAVEMAVAVIVTARAKLHVAVSISNTAISASSVSNTVSVPTNREGHHIVDGFTGIYNQWDKNHQLISSGGVGVVFLQRITARTLLRATPAILWYLILHPSLGQGPS